MKNPLTVTASFLLTSSIAFAAPTVTDNTISWPADGWYQVQDAETYNSICGGTASCDVEPGIYNVINHSTGERFENIRVGATSNINGPIEISGNTISWPDDGWYQVQNADDWVSICNGGRSCDVPNGIYNVINHSTGERFRNIVVSAGAGLNSFGDADAFYSALSQALINYRKSNARLFEFELVNQEEIALGTDPDIALPEAAPAADADGLASSVQTANDVTSTNIQELGVDEQDRVKVNSSGTQLFVLSNETQYFNGPEIFFEEAPIEFALAEDPQIERPAPIVSSPIDIDVDIDIEEVEPIEEEPLVTSLPAPGVWIEPERTTTLRILALDPDTPDATSINDLDIDLKGRVADGFYLFENGDETSAIITASGGGYWGYWSRPEAFAGRQSVIANVDVTDAANASLSSSLTIDGQIISSRRIGNSLFFASRYFPEIRGDQPWWSQTTEQRRDSVETADLAGLMPGYSINGEKVGSLVNPSSCFVATGVADQPYYSPDIITMGMIDLSTMSLTDSQCYLGASETLYASTESVFLATTRYDYSAGPVTRDGVPVNTEVDVFDSRLIWSDPRRTTDIHQFDIKSDKLSYAGSGSVPGHLGWKALQKPYRMSQKDGYLRIATMNDQQGPNESPILLNILKADGRGNLKNISSLPNKDRPEFIGKPGERLYASRFLGDRAYIVTFRQTDPLYALDLSDPNDPQVTGELEIEGYSDYLTPVDENHLLGIGKNAVAAEGGLGDGRGALVQGIKLSLFNVADPAAPKEVQALLLGERGTDSVAMSNPRAITIQPANEMHPMRVSFGASVHGQAFPVSSPSPEDALTYYNWSYTGLHGFDVTGGDNANISSRGALIIDKSDGTNRWSGNYWDDRSVMVNDAVFYISGKDVYPAFWENLANTPKPR